MSTRNIDSLVRAAEPLVGSLQQLPAGGDSSPAVESFLEICRQLEALGDSVVEPLGRWVETVDYFELARAAIASRLLAQVDLPTAGARLLRTALDPEPIRAFRALSALRQLRRSHDNMALLDVELRPERDAVPSSMRKLLIDPLMRQIDPTRDGAVVEWGIAHADDYIRRATALGLARLGGGAIVELLRGLGDDGDPVVAARAWGGLWFEGFPSALERLEAFAGTPRAEGRSEAISWLSQIAQPDSVDTVIEHLHDRSVAVRTSAIVGLSQMGYRSALRPLCGLLQDPQVSVAEQAAGALQRLTGNDLGLAWKGRIIDAESVIRAKGQVQALHDSWKPEVRYLLGHPATDERWLAQLHGPNGNVAFWALLQRTGDRFDYDPGADIIANWSALQKFRAWGAAANRAGNAGRK